MVLGPYGIHHKSSATRSPFATPYIVKASMVQVANGPSLSTSNSGNAYAGNFWGTHHSKVATLPNGDVLTLVQTNWSPQGWVLFKQASASFDWTVVYDSSQTAEQDTGREPPHLLVDPVTGTYYVVSWPNAGPYVWDSVSLLNTAILPSGGWVSNDHPYSVASIDPATGALYVCRSTVSTLKHPANTTTPDIPGTYQYAWQTARGGSWTYSDTMEISEARHNYWSPIYNSSGSPALIMAGGRDWLYSESGQTALDPDAGHDGTSYIFDKVSVYVWGASVDANPAHSLDLITQAATTPTLGFGRADPLDMYLDNQGRYHVLVQHQYLDSNSYYASGGMEALHYVVGISGTTPSLLNSASAVGFVAPSNQQPSATSGCIPLRITQDATGRFWLIYFTPNAVWVNKATDADTDGTQYQGWTQLSLIGSGDDWYYTRNAFIPRLWLGTLPALSNTIDVICCTDNGSTATQRHVRIQLA